MKSSKLNWFARRAELNSSAAKSLLATLEDNSRLNTALFAEAWPLQEFKLIQAWQHSRMTEDYADFTAQEDYLPAVNFFLSELYGDFGFVDRNQDIYRVYPVMVKLLPAAMLDTLTAALEFQAHSLELDMQMTESLVALHPEINRVGQLDLGLYIDINRQCVAEKDRRTQVGGVVSLGKSLVKVADHGVLLRLLKMMRMPARAAGFGQLQAFLEQGLSAFRQMPDADYFLHAVSQRETTFIDKLY
ncbi:MAG: hypothetical protein IMF09_06035 [Proteobacteria bacterium]|nr:hypothetical protein [Pseudomonadota bacterium]